MLLIEWDSTLLYLGGILPRKRDIRLGVVGYSEDMGIQILREAFPNESSERLHHFLRHTWPRNPDGSLKPLDHWPEMLEQSPAE